MSAPAPQPALHVDTQIAARRPGVPAAAALARWARAAYDTAVPARAAVGRRRNAGGPRVCIRIVNESESRRLNRGFRGKDAPTNVLSFPASAQERELDGALGDLAICAPVVVREARGQGKAPAAHWAHMVVHGVLHLLGYDHERPREARRMEQLEVEILRAFGYQNPYLRVVASRA